MQASKELWEHTLLPTKTDKESFEGGLNAWHCKWKDFLNEQKTDEKGKKRFVHKRLRSAHRSLKKTCPGCLPGMIIWTYKYPTPPTLLMVILLI